MERAVPRADASVRVRRLEATIARNLKASSPEEKAAIRSLLVRAAETIDLATKENPARRPTGGHGIHAPMRRAQAYFPVRENPIRETAEDDRRQASRVWRERLSEGYSYREAAQRQVGPMLTPREVAARLGVTNTTVNNWRKENKLLGVSFDDHQYLYPQWQFVDSPASGERGVLRHLDEILALLGDAHSWDKAQFFLTRSPILRGKSPLEVLREGRREGIDLVREMAERRNELEA